ncbi:hypothetical protein IFM12275_25070 [Nocardia sputorum]|nr:hypothetical protein IFM12275_25070 [Nocardia sputorum]
MSEEEAWERVRQGTAQFLPDGRATEGHHVMGDNTAAIALYRRNGYQVSSMHMDKRLPSR